MPPWPAPGTQTGCESASAAVGRSARKKSSGAALVIRRITTLLAGLVVLLTVQPRAQRCELHEVVLLLGGQVVKLTLDLGHLQLPEFFELLHLLDADHVTDLQGLHLADRAVGESLKLAEECIFALELRALQPR